MSRAFVKEDGPDNTPLPDLPLSPHPNFVTPRGLGVLRARLADLQETLRQLKARPERLDLLPEKAVERDIRYVEARLMSAILVDPGSQPRDEVAFGARVTVAGDTGSETTYEIVGEDEADAALNRVAPHSPLARALLGARVGEVVEWRRPAGGIELEVVRIAYD